MTDADTLPGLLARAWNLLDQGVRDTKAPARLLTLATIGMDGAPRARTIALRTAERATAKLAFHTDATTSKIAELCADPRAACHLWHPQALLQLRLQGTMRILTGPETTATWADVPQASLGNYGTVPPPGTPIPASDAYSRHPDPARFAMLHLTVDEIDIVHLAEDFHRRAQFTRSTGWTGQWRAP